MTNDLRDDWMRVDREPATLRSQVVGKLRAAITEGIFKPGDRMVERTLCERLDVSRPSLREAVRQLEAEGLLEVVPHRGPIVRALTREEATELFDLCALVEGQCARYFALRWSGNEPDRMEQALNELEEQLLIGKPDSVRRAKNAYYEAFIAGSKSEIVQTTVSQLNARLSQYWSYSQRHPERISQGILEMRQIVEAIRNRDADRAATAAAKYVQHAGEYVRFVLSEEQRPPGAKSRPSKRATKSRQPVADDDTYA